MLRQVLKLARVTVGDPKAGVKTVLSYQFTRRQSLQFALLVAVLGVLFAAFESFLVPRSASGLFAPGLNSPFGATSLQLAVMAMMILAIHFGGQVFGGLGSLNDAIIAVSWLQLINLLIQVFGFFLMLIFAVPFALVLMVSAVISTWMLVNFVAAIHGFKSLGKVFGGILGLYVAVSVIIGVLLDVFGLVSGNA